MEVVERGDLRGTHWVCPDCGYAVEARDHDGPLFCDDGQTVETPSATTAEMQLAILTREEAAFVETTGRL
jgi:hypothetical protein